MKKIILIIVAIATVLACSVYYYVFVYAKNHHRDPINEQGIIVTAEKMVNTFQKNEQEANTLYLNKTVEVTGKVASIIKNQENKTVISLQSQDPFSAVACTLKIENNKIYVGQTITIKGICTGFLSDVIVVEAALK
ncbi:MAG: hypothetical protein ORN58_01825 [Sediminibacterium sp.]|nr:hypothetical protein [Sediminibacterium sp.]